jgi:hypothetical protein
MASMKLQRWDWADNAWETIEEYDTVADNRAEENAYYAFGVHQNAGPHRLLQDGKTVRGYDNPDDHYNA